jgi:L-2-hydroxyglutarate oxidase LhgO
VERVEVDVAIVGGGIIGLALAESLSRRQPGASIALFERHDRFGRETSSRNSEVVHAGLYYKGQPLKARCCVQGRDLLYRFCEQQGIPHRVCGKLVLATHASQLPELAALAGQARENGAVIEELRAEDVRRR